MFLAIHEPITKNVSTFIEALKTGSTTAVLGMIIVFAVLAVIFVALVIMRKVLTKKPTAPAKAEENTPAPAPVAEEEEPTVAEADDGAIVAAIIAAISAHTGKPMTSFRVVSFKRRH
jgi:sodium pump decarboxylase gamma subunit